MINFKVGDVIARDMYKQLLTISPHFVLKVNILNSQMHAKTGRVLTFQANHRGTIDAGTIECISIAICALLDAKYPELSFNKLTIIQEESSHRASVVMKVTGPIIIKAFSSQENDNVSTAASG